VALSVSDKHIKFPGSLACPRDAAAGRALKTIAGRRIAAFVPPYGKPSQPRGRAGPWLWVRPADRPAAPHLPLGQAER
jgi:hypothetical protein